MFEILNQVLKGMKEHSLPLSVAANFALIALLIMVLDGWSISHTEHGWAIRASLQEQVGVLFKDDETQLQARNLLNARGYYEISTSSQETEAITRALGRLDAGHKLVNELRELSHKNLPPFEPRERKVTLMVSASPQIARGEARICENDKVELESKFIEFLAHDENNGFYVEATRIRRCSERRSIVEVNPADWRTLQLSGDVATDASARVYLHRPYERRADETNVVARNDG